MLLKNDIKNEKAFKETIEKSNGEMTHSDEVVELGYENYTMNQALKILLPETPDKEIPSGFEIVGDIAHMNLSK